MTKVDIDLNEVIVKFNELSDVFDDEKADEECEEWWLSSQWPQQHNGTGSHRLTAFKPAKGASSLGERRQRRPTCFGVPPSHGPRKSTINQIKISVHCLMHFAPQLNKYYFWQKELIKLIRVSNSIQLSSEKIVAARRVCMKVPGAGKYNDHCYQQPQLSSGQWPWKYSLALYDRNIIWTCSWWQNMGQTVIHTIEQVIIKHNHDHTVAAFQNQQPFNRPLKYFSLQDKLWQVTFIENWFNWVAGHICIILTVHCNSSCRKSK